MDERRYTINEFSPIPHFFYFTHLGVMVELLHFNLSRKILTKGNVSGKIM